MEKTIELDHIDNATDGLDRIHITQIDAYDESVDEEIEEFQVIHRTLHPRTTTVTSNSDSNKIEFVKSDRQDLKVSWTNIPERNYEQERDELVLYVQRNSRMVFAGIMEKTLLTDEYLKALVSSQECMDFFERIRLPPIRLIMTMTLALIVSFLSTSGL
jgi:hypothetical protein